MVEKLKPLRDIIKKNLRILFVGTRPGIRSSKTGHYFPGNSNMFWKLLYQSKLTGEMLSHKQDSKLIEYNYGLTDIVKKPKISNTINFTDTLDSTNRLNRLLIKFRPKIVAFVGKRGYQIYTQRLTQKYEYGYKGKYYKTRIYLIPSSSGQSYADTSYDEKLHWYKSLKRYFETFS